MGKALVLYGNLGDSPASGNENPVVGGGNSDATEANSHITIPIAGTFSLLGYGNLGGSGTNTVRFRVNGANGTMVVAAAGTGHKEDAVHTDTIAANDEVNFALTDTGTSPTYSYIRTVWEASGDHCSIYGSVRPAGLLLDATNNRFAPFSGTFVADWDATEANNQERVRCGTTLSYFQIRCTINAGVSLRTFHVRKNTANGNGIITFLAGATGIAIDTVQTDALSAGDLVGALCDPLLTTDDITISSCCCIILNTSASESDVFHGCSSVAAGVSRTGSTTAHYWSLGGCENSFAATTSTDRTVKPGFAGTARNPRTYLSANTYAGAGTLKLKNITDTTEISVTIGAGGGAGWYENTSDTLAFDAGDELVLEFDEGTSGSITVHRCGITLNSSVDTLFAQSVM